MAAVDTVSRWLWYRRGRAWPVRIIADKTCLSKTTVRRALQKLEDEKKVLRTLEMGMYGSNHEYEWAGDDA